MTRDEIIIELLEAIAFEQLDNPYPPEYEGGFRMAKMVLENELDGELPAEWANHHIHGWIPDTDEWWNP